MLKNVLNWCVMIPSPATFTCSTKPGFVIPYKICHSSQATAAAATAACTIIWSLWLAAAFVDGIYNGPSIHSGKGILLLMNLILISLSLIIFYHKNNSI